MKVDLCCRSFDYSLSEPLLERICKSSEGTGSALIPLYFYTFNKYQKSPVSSQNTDQHLHPRSLKHNRRILSPNPRERCLPEDFALPFTVQNQEDCSPCGQQIHLYIDPFFPEQIAQTTFKTKPGKPPRHATLRIKGQNATL